MYMYYISSIRSDDVTEFCQNELALLERCLRSNPKAYCIWVHRQWIMDHTPNPNWDQEKRLCDLFLSYDERNCESEGGGG